VQGLGGPEEDRRGGFERGGWAIPHFDEDAAALVGEVYGRADAFLFGRWTYEVFAGSWGTGSWGANEGDNPISEALNAKREQPEDIDRVVRTYPGQTPVAPGGEGCEGRVQLVVLASVSHGEHPHAR
jgi:hypothetical protein